MIRFLAEISERLGLEIHFTPSNDFSRTSSYNIYEMDISPPPKEETYWTKWGGTYRESPGTKLELFLGKFLARARAKEDLKLTPYSMFITDNKLLINVPKHPWLYSSSRKELSRVLQFLSNALDSKNPSNNVLRGERAPVKLDIPGASLSVRLSDNISGIMLNQGFSISLLNNDGYFDDSIRWNLFNTPVRLKKAIKENPEYEDFKIIRNGLVENTVTSFDSFYVSVAEKFRAMDNPVQNNSQYRLAG